MRARQFVRSRLLPILSLLILAAGRVQGLPQPPDPAASQAYPCHYVATWIWDFPGDGLGAVKGKVRYPSSTCDSALGPPGSRPALIFVHGNNMTWTDHDYLMAHLARNGFVTVSLDNDASSNEDRARLMISFLNSLHTFWGWRTRLSGDVVFAGHSRGGEAAVTAARMLRDDPSLGAEAYDVKAVVSIAPTDGGMDGSEPRESLSGLAADGYLALYGSHDTDVSGSPALTGSPTPHRTAFALYDRAGYEGSSEGIVLQNIDKAFVFLYGMNHRDFLDASAGVAFGNGTEEGRNAAKAYIHAFLRWKVFGQTSFRGFFDGTWRPESLASLELFQQLSAGPRRVVDNFENDDAAVNTLGGAVAKSTSGLVTFLDGELHELVKSSPHDTRGLRVTWAAPSWARWSIPDQAPFGVGPLRDVTSYDALSLRVAQVYGNTYNTVGQDQDFEVRLYTAAGYSNKVRVSLHGRIPYPDEFLCPDCGPQPIDFSKSALATVRVPLSAFTDVDLSDVRYVYLYFGHPERPTGAIALDSLAFTQ